MASRREQLLAPMSLDALADFGSNAEPGSPNAHSVQMEFLRRQTESQLAADGAAIRAAAAAEEAAQAAVGSAEAAKETARYTKDNARWMLWSVIVLAAASVANLLVSLAGVFKH